MKLLTLLPSEQLKRLRLACVRTDTIRAVGNPTSLFELAAQTDWDLVIVDPELAGERDLPSVIYQLQKISQPLIIYTVLSSASASAVASVSAHSLAGVVLRDYDDSPDLLRNSLKRVPIEFFGAQ